MNEERETAPAVRHVRCPVCDGTGEEVEKTDDMRLCRCGDCGLLFVNPRPSRGCLAAERENLFKDALDELHGSEIKKESGNADFVMKGFFKETKGKPAVLNGFGKSVLDVNCGLGFRVRQFQKYGWDESGIDVSKSAVEYARACYVEARECWFDQAVFPVRYDLVVFWSNFGSLPDPGKTVEKLKEILKQNGMVFVRLLREPQKDTLFHFDLDALRRLFAQNGFEFLVEDEENSFVWVRRKPSRRKPKHEEKLEEKPEEKSEEVNEDAAEVS